MRSVLKGDPDHRHRIILSVSPNEEDHAALRQRLSGSVWCLYEAACISFARYLVSSHNVGVVLCERDLRPGSWIDMLDALVDFQNAPPLIVTSRLADDRLWVEALNRGAYDVLAKPFYEEDLLRTLHLAWLRWYRGQQNASAATTDAARLKAG